MRPWKRGCHGKDGGTGKVRAHRHRGGGARGAGGRRRGPGHDGGRLGPGRGLECPGGGRADDRPQDTLEAEPETPADAAAREAPVEEAAPPAPTPSTTGALKVVGAQLTDAAGEPVQLRGVSTHGLAWHPQYVNQEFFTELREVWGANVVRLATYSAEEGGYATETGDRAALNDLVVRGVQYAQAADLYAVVDWHTLSDANPPRTSGPPRSSSAPCPAPWGTRTMSSTRSATSPTAARAGPTSRPMPRRSFPSSAPTTPMRSSSWGRPPGRRISPPRRPIRCPTPTSCTRCTSTPPLTKMTCATRFPRRWPAVCPCS